MVKPIARLLQRRHHPSTHVNFPSKMSAVHEREEDQAVPDRVHRISATTYYRGNGGRVQGC